MSVSHSVQWGSRVSVPYWSLVPCPFWGRVGYPGGRASEGRESGGKVLGVGNWGRVLGRMVSGG